MKYVERIMKAVEFIEAELEKKPTLEEIAARSYFSAFHFHRIFKAITGETVAGYVRQRRLSEACRSLIRNEKSIIELALTFGFESQESFTRAFKKQFKITPGKVRRGCSFEYRYLREAIKSDTFVLTSGGGTMKPRFEERPAFTVVGLSGFYTKQTAEEIPGLWDKFVPRMNEIKSVNDFESYGLCDHPENLPEGKGFRYMACVEIKESDQTLPEGMISTVIPAKHYAVFTHIGPVNEVGKTYDHIYGIWLPGSDYEVDSSHDFEYYGKRFDCGNPMNPKSEVDIYVPVKKKSQE